jgi:hypothetical protein
MKNDFFKLFYRISSSQTRGSPLILVSRVILLKDGEALAIVQDHSEMYTIFNELLM